MSMASHSADSLTRVRLPGPVTFHMGELRFGPAPSFHFIHTFTRKGVATLAVLATFLFPTHPTALHELSGLLCDFYTNGKRRLLRRRMHHLELENAAYPRPFTAFLCTAVTARGHG